MKTAQKVQEALDLIKKLKDENKELMDLVRKQSDLIKKIANEAEKALK